MCQNISHKCRIVHCGTSMSSLFQRKHIRDYCIGNARTLQHRDKIYGYIWYSIIQPFLLFIVPLPRLHTSLIGVVLYGRLWAVISANGSRFAYIFISVRIITICPHEVEKNMTIHGLGYMRSEAMREKSMVYEPNI